MHVHGLGRHRVREDKPMRVQCQPRRELPEGLVAVKVVAQHGGADGLEMHANLMEPARERACLEHGGFAGFTQHAPGGDGGLSGRGDAGEFLLAAARLGFEDRLPDDAIGAGGRLVANRPVELADFSFLELRSEMVICTRPQRDDEQAGSLFVEAVEQAEVARGAEVLELLAVFLKTGR